MSDNDMFSVLVLAITAAIFFSAMCVLGFTLRGLHHHNADADGGRGVVEDGLTNVGPEREERKAPDNYRPDGVYEENAISDSVRPLPDPHRSQMFVETRGGDKQHEEIHHRTSDWRNPTPRGAQRRPRTPVNGNNHYRPVTPSFPRPMTPVSSGEFRESSTNDGRRAEQQPPQPHPRQAGSGDDGNNVRSKFVPDHASQFKLFRELSEEEKRGIVDVNQCTVYVRREHLGPLLEAIEKKGDGRRVENVIAYFNKKNDKQLSAYEKRVRKSFKIKDERSGVSRFARMKVVVEGEFYRLTFHDYTPYVDAHAPKLDAFRQTIANERSRWDIVEARLHYNTQTINANSLSVLVPAKSL